MIIAPRNWFGQPMHRYAPPKAIATLGQRNPRRFSHPLPVHTVRFILQRAALRVHSSWPWRDRDAERPDSEPFWQDASGIGVAKGAAAVADRLWLMRHDRRLAALADQSNDPAKPACPPWRPLHCPRLAQPGPRQQQPIHGLSWSCPRLANPLWEALNNGR